MKICLTGNIVEMARTYDESKDEFVVEVRVETAEGRVFAVEMLTHEAEQFKFGQELTITVEPG